jgi:hypothetical protein
MEKMRTRRKIEDEGEEVRMGKAEDGRKRGE